MCATEFWKRVSGSGEYDVLHLESQGNYVHTREEYDTLSVNGRKR